MTEAEEKEVMQPYYTCFMQYVSFTEPHVAYLLSNNMIDAEHLKPYVRQWAEDITNKD